MQPDPEKLKSAEACARPGLVLDFLRASRRVSDDNVSSLLGQRGCAATLAAVYQEWAVRDGVLDFCRGVQTNAQQAEKQNQHQTYTPDELSQLSAKAREQITFAETRTDPRVDAYASRDEIGVPAASFDWIHVEETAESIVRESTVQAVQRRCGLDIPKYTKQAKN